MKSLKLMPVMATALMVMALAGCSEELAEGVADGGDTRVTATIDQADAVQSRTCIDNTKYAGGVVGLLWTPGDRIGVFGNSGTANAPFTTEQRSGQASFSGTLKSGEAPQYAYYPYSEGAGTDVTRLSGAVSAEQTFDVAGGLLTDDWKYGSVKSTDASGSHEFVMRHLFAMVKMDLTASGFPEGMAGEEMDYISFRVEPSDGTAAPQLNGSFTFDAITGGYTAAGDGTGEMRMVWGGDQKPTLTDGSYRGYLTVIPDGIREGDKFVVTIATASHKITYQLRSKATFQPGYIYNFPLDHAGMSARMAEAYGVTPVVEARTDVDPQPPTPEVLTGTFTCATLNVNGLRTGTSGATDIGTRITSDGWDFFSVSEDFQHSSFVKGVPAYSCGEAPGGALSRTDGIVLFWKTDGFTATGETRVKYTASYGGLFDGADTTKDKGFRYYLMTLSDGTEVDVYITHMNSGSDTGHLDARKKQLTQLAEYMISHDNNRPVIFMGDTNCRYTRDYVKTLLIDPLAAAGLTGNDPWIDFQWDGVWPTCPSSSIMTGASSGSATIDGVSYPDDDNNGQGYGFQKGEVVDKVIYFNKKDNKTQIKANSYLHDESYGSLSDHWPVVVEFTYTTTK